MVLSVFFVGKGSKASSESRGGPGASSRSAMPRTPLQGDFREEYKHMPELQLTPVDVEEQ